MAAFIAERVWHPSQKLEFLPGGYLKMTLETSAWKPLVRFILSWIPDVEVVRPVNLRERINEILINEASHR